MGKEHDAGKGSEDTRSPNMKARRETMDIIFRQPNNCKCGSASGATKNSDKWRVKCLSCDAYLGDFEGKKECIDAWDVLNP